MPTPVITGHQTGGYRGVDGTPHPLNVLCTEVSGNHDAGTGGNAAEEADQQEDQTAGGGDSGQSAAAQIVADDEGVDGAVQLLE